MEIPNCFYRISIKALILDETRTKFLIVQEENGKWELPGGRLDFGESPDDGLRREIQEEMGLEVTSVRKDPAYFFTGQRTSDSVNFANVVYEVTVENLDFSASDECVAIRFVSATEAESLINAFSSVSLLASMFDPKNH
jgi:8-oxo-dGTP diphosphatase